MRPRSCCRGFSLIEVLLAAALVAGLLVAGVALVFQLCSLLAAQADDPVFDRHAEGIDCFLRAYQKSGTDKLLPELRDEPGLLPGVGLEVQDDAPLLTGKPPMKAGGTISMAFRSGSGLWLVWPTRGARSEIGRVLLSPWVVDARILRYESKENRWDQETPDSMVEPTWRVVRLELAHAGHRRILLIPWEPRREKEVRR